MELINKGRCCLKTCFIYSILLAVDQRSKLFKKTEVPTLGYTLTRNLHVSRLTTESIVLHTIGFGYFQRLPPFIHL